jgi:hypothetical protein
VLKEQSLPFATSAKVIGREWQALPADKQDNYERLANGAKERRFADLARYEKTPQSVAHRRYLEAKDVTPLKGML